MTILYNPVSSSGRKPVLPMALLALGALLEGDHDYVIVDGNLSFGQDPNLSTAGTCGSALGGAAGGSADNRLVM